MQAHCFVEVRLREVAPVLTLTIDDLPGEVVIGDERTVGSVGLDARCRIGDDDHPASPEGGVELGEAA